MFNDSSFSITAAEITRENDVLSESLMELSVIDDKPANQQLSNGIIFVVIMLVISVKIY